MKKLLGISQASLQEIKKLFSDTDIQEFSYEENECEIHITRKQKHVPMDMTQYTMPVATPASTPTAAQITTEATPASVPADAYSDASKYEKITSPIMGTFYTSSSPESPNFTEVGANISAGNTICIVEAMKIFNEIKSSVSGKVVAILKQKGDSVNVDDVLFIIEK